jgi:hypothetical protein
MGHATHFFYTLEKIFPTPYLAFNFDMFCPFKQHYKCEGHFANAWKNIGHFFPNFFKWRYLLSINFFLAM